MTLAYLFLAHKLPGQLGRLVSTLYNDEDLFLIHVDAKVDAAPFRAQMEDRFGRPQNIGFVPAVRCDWAGYGHVEATFRGIDLALATTDSFTHLLLLTGQDYPIKPTDQIRSHFAANVGRSFMSWSAGDPAPAPDRRGNERWYWDGDRRRLELRYYLVRGRWRHLPNRYAPFVPRRTRMPLGLKPYQGLAYWNLSIEGVRYVRDLAAAEPGIERFFRRVWGCDEFIFQTMLVDSPLRASLVNEDLRFMNWDGFNPTVLGEADMPDLARSAKLFARKVDPAVDAAVMDRIDETLR